MMEPPLAVSVRRVHAEPASEYTASSSIDDLAWLALWEDGDVTYHRCALALLRAVQRRDRRDAKRADRRGEGAIFATVITWNDIPPGFAPPKEDA